MTSKTKKRLAALECRADPVEDGGRRVIRFLGATDKVARDGGILDREGWKTEDYLRNPVFLYAHDQTGLPVGRTVKLESTDEGLAFEVEFVDRETYPFADTVYRLYRTGYLRGVSVGFRVLETRPPTSEEKARGAEWASRSQELLELSAVPVGADPNALAVAARGLGLEDVPHLHRIGLEPFERLAQEVEKMSTKTRAVQELEDGSLVAALRPAEDFEEGTFEDFDFEGEAPNPVTIRAGMLEGELVAQGLVFGEGWDLETAQAWLDENEEALLDWRAPAPSEDEGDDAPPPDEGDEGDMDAEPTGARRTIDVLREVSRRLLEEAEELERNLEPSNQDSADDAGEPDESRGGAPAANRSQEASDPYGILALASRFAGE